MSDHAMRAFATQLFTDPDDDDDEPENPGVVDPSPPPTTDADAYATFVRHLFTRND